MGADPRGDGSGTSMKRRIRIARREAARWWRLRGQALMALAVSLLVLAAAVGFGFGRVVPSFAATPPGSSEAPSPPTAPAGSYKFSFVRADGAPIGWDRCGPPVQIAYDPDGEPFPAAADVEHAVAMLTAATNGEFSYEGVMPAKAAPTSTRTVVVGWATHDGSDVDGDWLGWTQ